MMMAFVVSQAVRPSVTGSFLATTAMIDHTEVNRSLSQTYNSS